MMSQKITRKDASYAAAKIAAIHGKPFATVSEWDPELVDAAGEIWFFDYVAQYGGCEIRAWRRGTSGEFHPVWGAGDRLPPREFFIRAQAYVRGALEFCGPEVKRRLDAFYADNPYETWEGK